jgi:hypothetical protein
VLRGSAPARGPAREGLILRDSSKATFASESTEDDSKTTTTTVTKTGSFAQDKRTSAMKDISNVLDSFHGDMKSLHFAVDSFIEEEIRISEAIDALGAEVVATMT